METPNIPPILTKENFWNPLQQLYPAQMKIFCDWIDEYKKRVNWNELFDGSGRTITEARHPKYHEIPRAMQIGIFFEFCSEHSARVDDSESFAANMQELIDAVKVAIADIPVPCPTCGKIENDFCSDSFHPRA